MISAGSSQRLITKNCRQFFLRDNLTKELTISRVTGCESLPSLICKRCVLVGGLGEASQDLQ